MHRVTILLVAGTGNDILLGATGTDTIVISDIETNGFDQLFKFTTSTDSAAVAEGRDTLQFSTADLKGVTGFVEYTGVGTAVTLQGGTKVAFVEGAGATSSVAEATFVFDDTTGCTNV